MYLLHQLTLITHCSSLTRCSLLIAHCSSLIAHHYPALLTVFNRASNSENFGKARVKSETLEQRRERKKQVKETKKVIFCLIFPFISFFILLLFLFLSVPFLHPLITPQVNREKKKLVKQAYKLEEIKQTTLMVAQRVNQRVVYKF